MKMTKIFVQILCFLCLVCLGTVGYVAESSGQLIIAVPNLATDLPTDWRPEAGGSLSFSVKVTKPAHYSGGRLIATLSDVTAYPGECGNRLSPYNDLELRSSSNSGWRVQTAKVSLSHPIAGNHSSSVATEWMTLEVSCEDYAAYGKLTFTTSGSSIAEASPVVITIPRDVNGNKIADGWRNDETTADPNNANPSKNYVADWDEESGPAAPNTQRGDTLAVLDEYRGLYVNGTWTDTDPDGWDVFLRTESGLSSAGSLPGMSVWSMGLNEVDHNEGYVMPYQASSARLSGNRGGHGNVHAIRLKNNPVAFDEQNPDNGRWGYMGIGPPGPGTMGEIFTERIEGGLWAGQTKSGMIAYVVAHEIGHGVSLWHCPNLTDLDCYMWPYTDSASSHVTQYHSHHLVDYDLKEPNFGPQAPAIVPADHKRSYDPEQGTWALLGPNELHPVTVRPTSDGGGSGGIGGTTTNQITTNSGSIIISTNTGSSSYGCDYNAQYDYCTDTGTCSERSGEFGIGMCGHRWCCCAPAQ